MNVAIISRTDTGGGATLVPARLHRELRKQGIESRMIVAEKSDQSDAHTYAFPRERFLSRTLNKSLNYVLCRLGFRNINTLHTFTLTQFKPLADADVINFHNLHGDYLNYLALPRITRNKPAVLTLHDMWTFTGHCVYSFDCERWKTGCGQCPYLNVYCEMRRDVSALELKLKTSTLRRSKLHFIAISTWVQKLFLQSRLADCPIHYIPNGVDLEIFRPLHKPTCREILSLPKEKKLILFAAAQLNDPRKGGDLLAKALAELPPSIRKQSALVVMGKYLDPALHQYQMPVYPLGFIHEDRLKTIIFSACDLFVFPTRADNLPLILQETMACGLPMISFAVGGVPDLIRYGDNGLLAAPENAHELAQHIHSLLTNPPLCQHMATRCREIAESEYSITLQAERYRKLFESLLPQVSKQ